MKNLIDKLQEPFKASEIEWRVGSTNSDKTKGLALAYVTNRAIQNRLDSVFGVFGWQNQYREWKGSSQICGISVFDSEKQEWITKWDGADDSATEAVKGGLSDSMKRAAYQWGIGRYLYELPNMWVDIKPVGKSYGIVKEPTLPSWALPKSQNAVPQADDINSDIEPRISETKISVAKELSKKLNISDSIFSKTIKAHFGLEHIEELSESQGDKLMILLNGKVNG